MSKLKVDDFLGDDYVNNTLNGLVEFPAYILLSFTMDRLGRKPLLSGCLLVGGLACLGSTTVLQFAGDSTSKDANKFSN